MAALAADAASMERDNSTRMGSGTEAGDNTPSLKFVLVGDAGVGKTCLVERFVRGSFPGSDVKHTVGLDYASTVVVIGEASLRLQLWDTAGEERFRSVTNSYYRYAAGVFVVFDITSRVSFEHAERWLRDAERVAPDTAVRVLVGNKCDLSTDRVVTAPEGEERAKQEGARRYFECSALSGDRVQDLFIATATDFYRSTLSRREAVSQVPLPVLPAANGGRSCGC